MNSSLATAPPTPSPPVSVAATEFRVLGPLSVSIGGKPISLGGPKQRLVLALLVLETNRVLSADRLIDRVWGDEPPEAARGTLQAYVSRLRKALGPGKIEARPPGYVLLASPDQVDAQRFERLAADARRRLESDPKAAAAIFDLALDLWRGPALDDLDGEAAIRAQITRLEELRLAAAEDRVEAKLAMGEHSDLIPHLERLVADNPLRERLWGQLMLALYRSGRQAEALAAYQRARDVLTDELGIDLSPELQRLQERVLKQDPDLELKGRRLRGYELIERVGEGVFGTVYRATQPTVHRDVAVKAIRQGLANQPEFIRRFEPEAQLVARLEHPFIVPLYDYWRGPDGAYLAVRYMRGGSLKDRLERKGPLLADELARLVEQIGSALAVAHRQGVVHRDVRPANILFDEEENAYLSDFGIAMEVAVANAPSSRYRGLASYLAPEEIQAEQVSAATDIYSLGVVLYEALAGRHPFGDAQSSEVRDRQLNAPMPPLDAVRPDLPKGVGAVLSRATEKNAAARYPDALSLASAFRAALEGRPTQPAAADSMELRNPYKGLRPFDEADASDFFGREHLTDELVAHLREPSVRGRFLAVVGPSGSGKSSAVRAGLVPAIRRGAAPGSDRWFVVVMHPGAEPLLQLETALLRIAVSHPTSLLEELERDDGGLLRAVDWVLPRDDSELLIVVDQFEELFTLVYDDDRRVAFMKSLASAVSDPASRVRVVLTLRADFYDRPLLYPGFGDLLATQTHTVTPMRQDELARAIAAPAERVGATLEPSLLAEVLSDVAEQPGSLPLLQYALTELFEHRTDSTLIAATYRTLGGVAGALAGRAEQLYRRLDESGRDAAREVFLRLVTLGGEGSEDARRRVQRSELAGLGVDQQAMDRVVDTFGAHRLLSFDRDPVTRGPTIELAHEALLRSWRRLRGWIDWGREDLRTYRRFSADAAEWSAAGRDSSFLARGSRLEQLEAWAAETHIATSSLEREYLDVSLRTRESERVEEEARQRREAALKRRSVNRLRALVAVLMAGVLVAGTLAVVAQDRGRQAEQSASRAGKEARVASARELAAAAVANLDVDTERSLLLALQAVETTRRADGTVLPEAAEVLHAALQAHRLVLTLPGYRGRFSNDGSRLLVAGLNPGEADVYAASTGELIVSQTVEGRGQEGFFGPQLDFSPDGTRFVTIGGAHGVAVYDTTTGQEVWRAGSCCADFTITPDGRFLLVTFDGNVTAMLDLGNGEQVNRFPAAGGWAFSPDGRRAVLTTGGWDSALGAFVAGYIGELHEPGGGKHLLTLLGQGDVNGAGWSPDGSTLATSSPDDVVVWNPQTGKRRFTFAPPSGNFVGLAVGSNAGLLATAMSDDTAIVWKLWDDRADPILRLAGHSVIHSIAFSPDGTRLVTGGDDGLIKVWDVTAEGGGESLSVSGSGGFDLSSDERILGVGRTDGHLDTYDLATGRRVVDIAAHTGRVEAVAFGSGGRTVATASSDGTVKLSEASSGRTLWTVPRANDGDVAISPDDRVVATPGDDGTVSLLDATTGKPMGSLYTGDGEARTDLVGRSLAFSPDGKFLAGGGGFPSVYVWNIERDTGIVLTHPFVEALAFSPDGRRLISAGPSEGAGSVRVWDPHTGRQVGSIKRLPEVTDLAFSPDGTRIATSSTDGTLGLWDATTLEQLMTLATDANGKLAFSPDGTRMVYGAKGGVIRVLALPVDDLIKLANSRLGRSLTEEECERYLHVDACPSQSK
jgi:WD40 repeat protein/serine/threonine protein kinase